MSALEENNRLKRYHQMLELGHGSLSRPSMPMKFKWHAHTSLNSAA